MKNTIKREQCPSLLKALPSVSILRGAKHLLQTFFTGFIAFCLLSCSIENDDQTQNDYGWLVGFGIIRIGQNAETDFTIKMDDGSVLYPTNNYSTESLQDSDRVLVNYSIVESIGFGAAIYNVWVNSLTKLLYKGILDITPDDEDSIGNDPIHVKEVWATKNMLTFQLEFYGSDKSHSVNLVKQIEDRASEDQPVTLGLRHNGNDDQQIYLLTAFVTFDLSSLQIDGQESVSYVVSWKDYDGRNYSYTGNYSY